MDELEALAGVGRAHFKTQVVRGSLSDQVTFKLKPEVGKSQSLEMFEAEEIVSAKALRLEPDPQTQETERRS